MKHKICLSLICCMCAVCCLAQNPKVTRKGMTPITQVNGAERKAFYEISQLAGKWQEVKRTPKNGKGPVEFTDTLLMSFDSNRVEIKDATSMRMTMKGEVYIDPPYNLVAAGDEYIIRSLNKEVMLLDDGDNLKEMHKREIFTYETLGKLKIQQEIINEPVHIEQKNAEGKWLVYRRQAMAGSVDTDAVVIKTLEIFASNTIGSAPGQVSCYKSDVLESFSCKVIFGDKDILVITDKYVWEFNTYKADGKEFVFGEAGRLLYYAKK
ncbi:MAG: hypothetical protein JST81_06835 [Bacteroidetes bacterium]|nr:hypothetical protein [Bacteroidota bacterium]